MCNIAVVLTSYKRPHTFSRQLEAIERQSLSPKEIVVWHNGPLKPPHVPSHVKLIQSEIESVWPRFDLATEIGREFVCVFDDDTIPGKHWLKNCYHHFSVCPGLYGARGVCFLDGTRKKQKDVRHNSFLEKVDLIGHSWFLHQDILWQFQNLRRPSLTTAGEDYALAMAAQNLELPAMVPPQPTEDKDLWGSLDHDLGIDDVALYLQPDADIQKEEAHKWAKEEWGWRTMNER